MTIKVRPTRWTPLLAAGLLAVAAPARADGAGPPRGPTGPGGTIVPDRGMVIPGSRPVSLAAAIAAAGSAPEHRAAVADRTAAQAAAAAAGAWPATTLAVSTSQKTAHLGLVASLPLPLFGTLGASREVARADLDVAAAQVGAADLDLRRLVTRAWIELARAEARAALSAESAAREARLATVTRQRVDSGDAARADVVQADAAARRALAQAGADRTAIGAASADLAAVLGWDPTAALHADGGLPGLDDLAPPGDVHRAAAAHPVARVAGAQVDAEAARVDEARAARWPHLALDLESAIDDPTLPGSDVRVGLSLEVPLFGKAGAGEHAAAARRAAAEARRAATRAALDGQAVGAVRRYQAARDRAGALATDVLPAQREAAALARAAFTEGEGGLVSVLEADRSLAEVEREAMEARADAALARADLVWATGGAR
jgi:outer membrane protein TolC